MTAHRHDCWWRLRFRNPHQRRGTVLVAALVCMLVVMTLLGNMLQGTLRVRRQLRTQRDLRQTELLLEAGADRAAYRLFRETDYRGETWAIPAEQIVGRGDGQVTMEASRDSDGKPWQVRVVAEYPLGSELSVRRSHTFIVQPQSPQSQE